MPIEKLDYLLALESDASKLVCAAEIGLEFPVPSCPPWTVGYLIFHTGAVHRTQAKIIRTRSTEPPTFDPSIFDDAPQLLEWIAAFHAGDAPQTPPAHGLIEWFQIGVADLIESLRATNEDEPMWSWSETKRARHYLRMMPIETTLHRWDVQGAFGEPEPIGLDLAREGIDHNFDVMLPMRRAQTTPASGDGETYLFETTDVAGCWHVSFDSDTVRRAASDAAVTARGTASDLFLYLWHRVPVNHLEVTGNAGLLDRYFDLVPPL